jgi:hypothetical protein
MAKSPLQLDARFVRSDSLVGAEMGARLLMMHIESGKYYDLNATARLLWEALSDARRVDELCSLLQARFEVDDETCLASVKAMLTEFFAENMIVQVD